VVGQRRRVEKSRRKGRTTRGQLFVREEKGESRRMSGIRREAELCECSERVGASWKGRSRRGNGVEREERTKSRQRANQLSCRSLKRCYSRHNTSVHSLTHPQGPSLLSRRLHQSLPSIPTTGLRRHSSTSPAVLPVPQYPCDDPRPSVNEQQ
jgi:hypothetical protein